MHRSIHFLDIEWPAWCFGMIDEEAVRMVSRLTRQIEQARCVELGFVEAVRQPRFDPGVLVQVLFRPVSLAVQDPLDLVHDQLVYFDRHGPSGWDERSPARLLG